jgi:hypothetical protein
MKRGSKIVLFATNCCSDQIRRAGYLACMGEMKNVYIILVGKPKSKKPFRRSRRRWKDTIKIYLKDLRCKEVECGLKNRGIYWLAELQLASPREVLYMWYSARRKLKFCLFLPIITSHFYIHTVLFELLSSLNYTFWPDMENLRFSPNT